MDDGLFTLNGQSSDVRNPRSMNQEIELVVIFSANAEWKSALNFYKSPVVDTSPLGDYFIMSLAGRNTLYFHGGWGKIAAAASTQYIIDRWHPRLLINIGTCGGFEGQINLGDIILAEKTIVYDIQERMGDPLDAIRFFTTEIDLSILNDPLPLNVKRSILISADQDIDPSHVDQMQKDYPSVAADWESGAIAWTAHRNETPVLILRAVSDLVNSRGGELYNQGDFELQTRQVLFPLFKTLPQWVQSITWDKLK